jgi:hypothetical protein
LRIVLAEEANVCGRLKVLTELLCGLVEVVVEVTEVDEEDMEVDEASAEAVLEREEADERSIEEFMGSMVGLVVALGRIEGAEPLGGVEVVDEVEREEIGIAEEGGESEEGESTEVLLTSKRLGESFRENFGLYRAFLVGF